MATLRPQPEAPPEPVRLESRAASDLRFIRETMESAGSFTAVPGRGGVAMGVVGLAAAGIAALLPGPDTFLWVWLGAAGIALSLGGLAMARGYRSKVCPSRVSGHSSRWVRKMSIE